MRFAIKHLLAVATVSLGAAVFAGVAYFVLLAWATVGDLGIGGPFALPFMVLGALIGSFILSIAVLFPLTAITELLRVRLLRSSLLVEPPLLLALAAFLALGTACIISFERHLPLSQSAASVAPWAGLLLLPLVVYWLSMQATDLLVSGGAWLLNRLTRGRSRLRPIGPSA